MKTSFSKLFCTVFVLSTISFGCKKKTDDQAAPVVLATSQWTFNGTTYKVTNSSYDDTSNTLTAFDDPGAVGGGNYVRVIFGSIVKPTKNVTLTAVSISTASNPSNCEVQVGNIYDTYYQFGHISTGKAGDQVVVTVSATGKLTATFTNVTVTTGATGTGTLLVSGTIAEN